MVLTDIKVDFLVVDTTAFIENTPLQDIAHTVVTAQEVINEIKDKRQLRRLVVLPYDLVIKDVFPENIKIVTEFSQKTGDYPNLSATDIKVMALTYQLEKEQVGIEHLKKTPIAKSTVRTKPKTEISEDVTGFFMPKQVENTSKTLSQSENSEYLCNKDELLLEVESLKLEDDLNLLSNSVHDVDNLMPKVDAFVEHFSEESSCDGSEDDGDDNGWITPSNVHEAKKQINFGNLEEKSVKVACITTDFAMQNVLKQMNLNIATLDGRIIKQLKTYILRCYTCFKTTSIMTSQFCLKCGNNTLKRVSVSVDSEGKQKIHINTRHPLTARGKKFSLPTAQGGKHSSNPILSADQRMPDQKSARLAKSKNNSYDKDDIAGFSPFVMRDVNSKSAQSVKEVKHWMRKNPNEAHRRIK